MKDSLKKKLLDQKTASIRIRAWKKKKKSSRNKSFINISLPLNSITMNERTPFPLNRKQFPLTVVKDSFIIFIHEMKKLFPVEGICEKLAQIGPH